MFGLVCQTPAPTLAPTQSQAILADVANNQFAKSTPVAPPQINESSVSSLQQPLPAPTGVSAQDSPVPTLQASPIDQPIPSLQLSSVPQDQAPLPAPTGVSAQDSPVPTLQASPIDSAHPIPSTILGTPRPSSIAANGRCFALHCRQLFNHLHCCRLKPMSRLFHCQIIKTGKQTIIFNHCHRSIR